MQAERHPRDMCDLDCLNYIGAMEDCHQAVMQMIRLLNGQTTPERAREWVRLNYPKLAFSLEEAPDAG